MKYKKGEIYMKATSEKTVMKTVQDAIETFNFGNRKVFFYVESNRGEKINQICDSLYPFGNYKMPYHYHDCGAVTYMVIRGSVELILNGEKSICKEGDIVNVPSHCPYGMTILEEDTLVREIYTNIDALEAYYDIEQMKLGGNAFAATSGAKTEFEEKHHYFVLTEPVEIKDADKKKVHQISTEEKEIYRFNGWEGINCILKVGRWDLKRVKEIWEYKLSKNYQLQYFNSDKNESIYTVKSGKVMAEINDEIYFAEEGDIIHVPAYRAFTITAVEDNTSIYNLNVTTRLFRMLEMLELAQRDEAENTKNKEWMNWLLELNDSNLTGFVKTDFTA